MRLVAFCKRLGNTISCEERVANRFRYQGEQYDPITRQYYLRARYYNPVIGRFIQEDTYYGDGLNLYEYCRNNTITYKDPTGHNICPTQRDLYHKYKEEGMSPQEAYQKMRKELGLDSKSGYKDSGVGNGNDPWRSYESGRETGLKEFDIVPYGKFKDYPGDGLTGHELLQNAWLEANGKIPKRGAGLSTKNLAIALRENPIHKFISGQQKSLGLNKKNLAGTSWRKNVLDNIQIMKDAGVPRDKIAELAWQTRKFAIDNGF